MSPEYVHTIVRLIGVVIVTLAGSFVTRSLFLAYRADYGFPKKKGINGRSNLDMKVLRREILFGILFILSLMGTIGRVRREEETPLTFSSLLITGFVFVFALTYMDLWWAARKERLGYKERRGGGSGTRIGP